MVKKRNDLLERVRVVSFFPGSTERFINVSVYYTSRKLYKVIANMAFSNDYIGGA